MISGGSRCLDALVLLQFAVDFDDVLNEDTECLSMTFVMPNRRPYRVHILRDPHPHFRYPRRRMALGVLPMPARR